MTVFQESPELALRYGFNCYMSSDLTNIEPPEVGTVRRLDGIRRTWTRVQSQWRTLRPLLRRAFERVRSAGGPSEKIREVGRLARRARARLLRRAAVASAQQATFETGLSPYIAVPDLLPGCQAYGGGLLAVSLAGEPQGDAEIVLRDRFGVLHSTRPMEVIERCGAIGKIASTARSGIEPDDQTSSASTVQLIVQAPPELFEGMTSKVEVQLQGAGGPVNLGSVSLDNSSLAAVTKISVENNLVMFSGATQSDFSGALNLGVFVDGEISASTIIQVPSRSFSGAILIDPRHLDGSIHHLELRELPRMCVLASLYEFLPLHLTPWEALQTYARAPLDGTLSPAARHHFRSHQLWLEKIAEGRTNIPPVTRLYAEILHGFRKRQDYPPLSFPTHERPVASVVIPVHGKFEVTYLCLCSLLFAYNDTPFEVIIVDDGSSDETLDIARVVSGIRLLRHESALGYVDSCNEGAALAKGEFVVFLNNDVEATARWLDELIAVFRSFDNVGLVGSKLVYPDGQLQEAGGIVWRSGDPWNVGRNGNAHDPRYNYLRQTDYVSGAAMMLPLEIWKKVEGFSPEFAPGYFEDTDLAMKVREVGLLVVYVPTSTIIHFEGKSAGTNTASGMKQYQEINRPKFKQKWSQAYSKHRAVGDQPDREKDRAAALRVLFLDHQYPNVDGDAGSYAAFQEIRLFQSLGAKVTFLPRNLAWMDRHTQALQRIGVECLYAPFVANYANYISAHAAEYDVVFVCRYQIAEQIVPLVRSASPSTKIIFNLADLHFLRQLREVAAKTEGHDRQRPEQTRAAELAVVQSCDLTLSYSDVELAVLESHLKRPTATARLPWISESKPSQCKFSDTKDILFLGGFSHPPNAQAVEFFARAVMPGILERLPDVHFDVVGKGAEAALERLSSPSLRIVGYVADLDDVMTHARVFVAPLLAGAGLKGKVVEAMSRGVPSVLSPVAAEGTGLVDGLSCLIADTPQRWIDCVVKLHDDERLWTEIGRNALKLAETRFSFQTGIDDFERALRKVGVTGRRKGALAYRHARPLRYGN